VEITAKLQKQRGCSLNYWAKQAFKKTLQLTHAFSEHYATVEKLCENYANKKNQLARVGLNH